MQTQDMTTSESLHHSCHCPCCSDPRILVYAAFTTIFQAWAFMASSNSSNSSSSALDLAIIAQMIFFVLLPRAMILVGLPCGRPRQLGIAAFLLHRVYQTACRSPSIWDSDSWSAQSDIVVALWLLLLRSRSSGTSSRGSGTKTIDNNHDNHNGNNPNDNDNDGNHDTMSTEVVACTVKEMFSCFYFAAGFWKLNTHFWDPNASCSTVFFVQLVANYIALPLRTFYDSSSSSLETATRIAKVAKMIAPTATLLVELTQGGLMILSVLLSFLLPSYKTTTKRTRTTQRTCERMGVTMALLFHGAVCMTPPPNDISGFALQCAAPLVWFASPQGVTSTLKQVSTLLFSATTTKTTTTTRAAVPAVLVLMVSIGISYPWTPNNWAFFLYSMLGSFILLSIYNEDVPTSTASFSTDTPSIANKSLLLLTTIKRPIWSRIAVGCAIFYSFGGLITGLQEEGTPNMFANLKVHGGSNHFFLPTGLLFHYYHDYHNNDNNNHHHDHFIFGGGVVRIERTTSSWMKNVYPADMTAILQPPSLAAALLDRVGNPAPAFFNPGANRILGIAPKPGDEKEGQQQQQWYRYTVPALELKRLLREAKSYDSNFELTYAQLPGTRGDEVWRASAVKRLFEVVVRDGQVTECTVTVMHDAVASKEHDNGKDMSNNSTSVAPMSAPCSPTDLPMLPDNAVPYWIQKLSMYHAYPIVTDDITKIPSSIVCFGP